MSKDNDFYKCRDCGAKITWGKKNGRSLPMDDDPYGITHYVLDAERNMYPVRTCHLDTCTAKVKKNERAPSGAGLDPGGGLDPEDKIPF